MQSAAKSQRPKLRWLILLWTVVVVLWVVSGYLLEAVENRGTFGDMFGAVNALFSGLAFATLIYTAWMQREELALQREELAATRAELEGQKLQLLEQTKTFALQRFEDSLFALFRMHGEIVGAMDLVSEKGRTTRSRDCFAVWYRRLQTLLLRSTANLEEPALQDIQESYRTFYKEHQAELGHYFRHLYHIVKFIKTAPIENKRHYTALLRAQLSGYEHLMLFYNGLSEYGFQKFKPLIEEFALLENMPQEHLVARHLHIKLYEPSAYGEDSVA